MSVQYLAARESNFFNGMDIFLTVEFVYRYFSSKDFENGKTSCVFIKLD